MKKSAAALAVSRFKSPKINRSRALSVTLLTCEQIEDSCSLSKASPLVVLSALNSENCL